MITMMLGMNDAITGPLDPGIFSTSRTGIDVCGPVSSELAASAVDLDSTVSV